MTDIYLCAIINPNDQQDVMTKKSFFLYGKLMSLNDLILKIKSSINYLRSYFISLIQDDWKDFIYMFSFYYQEKHYSLSQILNICNISIKSV